MTYHPFIQNAVDELLAKASMEPLTGGAGFYQIYLWFLIALVVYDLHSVLYS